MRPPERGQGPRTELYFAKIGSAKVDHLSQRLNSESVCERGQRDRDPRVRPQPRSRPSGTFWCAGFCSKLFVQQLAGVKDGSSPRPAQWSGARVLQRPVSLGSSARRDRGSMGRGAGVGVRRRRGRGSPAREKLHFTDEFLICKWRCVPGRGRVMGFISCTLLIYTEPKRSS